MACRATVLRVFCGFVSISLLQNRECVAQSSISLTLPKSVNTIVGDPITLPATYQTQRRVISVVWNKLNPQDSEKRIPVFSYFPLLGSTESFGTYSGRAELAGKASIKIDATTVQDEGKYVLTVTVDGLPPEEGFVTVNMMVPPVVDVGPANPYVTASGRSASLTCAVKDARPNITSLYWEKDGVRVDNLRFDTKYSGGNIQSPNLLIRHVTRGDAGRYKCVADHVVRSASDALKMDVRYPASIISISDSLTGRAGDRITMQCVAEGNPLPNITWSRNGVRLRSDDRMLSRDVCASSLVLSNVPANATGTYVCTAVNNVGKSDVKSLLLSIRASRSGSGSVDALILVGSIAGGLWLLICLCLTIYFVRRRRQREEKKRFSFYYNMGKRQDERAEDRPGEETLEVTRHPNLKPPAKPRSPTAPYGGIETIRRTASKSKVRRYARALYTYRPQEENELHLETDDVIEVLEGEDGGWCLGYLRGRIGLFPSNYVKFLSASQVSAAKLKELYDPTDAKSSSSKGSL
ncbi:protein amalgam-like [Branchiostoma floridae]|uniref:Protein amalgam-like n=1 Tax=Branchiostoma floridae TaxID=7739 RepID=A0A9J7MAY4_BRAFL|nr:protein amalgam-like [Branchiostoma floridae]